jgi:hypothetical protein
MNLLAKKLKKYKKKQEKLVPPYFNLPMHTCDTVVWVCSVPRCAKIHYCTRTCVTRFGNTAGLPVPVGNPTHGYGKTHRFQVMGSAGTGTVVYLAYLDQTAYPYHSITGINR